MYPRLILRFLLTLSLAMPAARLSAALLPAGVTVDTLTDTSKWATTTTRGTFAISTVGVLNNDPLDPANTRMVTLTGWPTPYGRVYPGMFAYRAGNGLRISKVKLSVCSYDPSETTPRGIGIADSAGNRISSVSYNGTFVKGTTPYIESVAAYSGITPVYTQTGQPNPAQGGWTWHTMEVDLPESAVSLIDGHTERFNAVSIGFWDWNGWAPYVGTVQLTVVPATTPPASITVTAPNGYTSWNSGSGFTPRLPVIKWASNGVDNVKIDLYKGGVFVKNLVASMPAAFGTYTGYTIDSNSPVGGDFRIRVSSVETPLVFDESDNDFAIQYGSTLLVPTATVQSNPPSITLHWPSYSQYSNTYYEIFRRPMSSAGGGWGSAVAGGAVFNGTHWVPVPGGLGVMDTSWTDTTAVPGVVYEYRVERDGYGGFVSAGIDVPMVESRGTVILLVDDTMAAPLAAELLQMKHDLVGDGWKVIQHDVPRKSVTDAGWKESVVANKALIVADALADPNVKAVYIVGHVPIPYSGNLNPDGHAEHKGAWPADGYYGDLDGSWTDTTVNNTATALGADFAAQRNLPGDGKFDQTMFPSTVDLAVGRVDLQGMTAFALSETELLRQYLNKNHNFRSGLIGTQPRVLVDDNFLDGSGDSGRLFSALTGGEETIERGDYISTLRSDGSFNPGKSAYLFAYGNGGGGITQASGIGTTADFAYGNPRAIFTGLFGSYFGDWDHANGFLRAPLATSYGLTSCWAGRPNWTFHPMGMGETTGYSTLVSQNANYDYGIKGYGTRMVHIALMGDPTLRLHVVPPVTSLASVKVGSVTRLSWSASADPAVIGYHVYRATNDLGPFIRLTGGAANALNPAGSPITVKSYTDFTGAPGTTYKYMVRAVKNETGDIPGGGNYYNLSQGVFSGPQVVANYESEIKSPAESAALGWTYFTTDQGGSNLTASLAHLWSIGGSWDAANRRYTNTYGGVGLVEAYAADCAIGVINPAVQPGYITPGDNGACFVARWTSDVTTPLLNIAGSCGLIVAESGSNYGTLKFLIRHNGGAPQLMTTNVYNDTTKYSYSYDIPNVAVGDTIDLIIWGDPHNWETKALLRSTFSASLNVSEPITPMQAWLAANNLPTDGAGNGAPGASPAGDAIKNLMKFALGIDAWTSGYQGHLAHGAVNLSGKDYLTLTYNSPEPAVATCTVKTSADLVTWSAAQTVGVSSSAAAGIRTTTVRDSISTQDAPRRFIRLEVEP